MDRVKIKVHRGMVGIALVTLAGCPMAADPVNTPLIATTAMRQACPTLSDDIILAFVEAIDTVRLQGINQTDALSSWVQSCEAIPPDGNFGGDQSVCADCLSVLVGEVYP